MIAAPSDQIHKPPAPWKRLRPVTVLVLLAALAFLCREPVRHLVLKHGVLLNDAPTAEAMEQLINSSKNPLAAARMLWDTGKIVQREHAIHELVRLLPAGKPIPTAMESWVLAAALDPDLNVRETALGILGEHKHPALAAICKAELADIDPDIRHLGLEYVRRVPAEAGVPSVVPLLKDADPRTVASALKLLENWTGQKFGVRMSEAIPVENKMTGLLEYSDDSKARATAGATRAEAWWREHQTEFSPLQLEIPATALAAVARVSAGDFSLSTFDGRRIKLSDLRGKVVLLNFWTTWCTACVGEMPELVALQKSHQDGLVILGISLDCVPDEDGDAPVGSRTSVTDIRKKVARTAKSRNLNYPILLDETDIVGGRFNGGELPTTVIVDADGNVRRRFIGTRTLPVFEAMIAEARLPRR